MTRRKLIGATAILGYYAATVFCHLEVSLWLVRRRESVSLGTFKFADFLPQAGALLLAAVVVWQARRACRGHNRALTLAGWAAWLAAVLLVDRFLVYAFPEYLHYPQYALLAWMAARLIDPERRAFAIGPVLLAVTLMGIADEALQYAWITTSYSNYLDFNDFILNLLGGAAGLLLYYGFSPAGRMRRPSSNANAHRAVLGFSWLALVMLLLIGAWKSTSADSNLLQPIERQPSYDSWIPGPRAGRYYVLDPVTGTLILIGLGALVSAAPIALQLTKPRDRG